MDQSIAKIYGKYKENLNQVDRFIKDNISAKLYKLTVMAEEILFAGGKRVRPLILLMSAQLSGYKGDDDLKFAAVSEYIHAASIVHDDVIDQSDKRRGKKTLNLKYGSASTVLLGDYMFATAFEIMGKLGNSEIVRIFSEATKKLSEGEIIQLSNVGNLDLEEEIVLDTLYRKTAALIEASAEVGYLLNSQDEGKIAAIKTYAKNIGLAFQLADDILDFTADPKNWGKPIGNDLIMGKVTLPILRGYKNGTKKEKILIEAVMKSETKDPLKIDFVKNIITQSPALQSTKETAKNYIKTAKLALEHFDNNEIKEDLKILAEYTIHRLF